jgi:hypothetical protein
MTARRKFTAGLRRLGHAPQRQSHGGYACRKCDWVFAWGGGITMANLPATLRAADVCRGR